MRRIGAADGAARTAADGDASTGGVDGTASAADDGASRTEAKSKVEKGPKLTTLM